MKSGFLFFRLLTKATFLFLRVFVFLTITFSHTVSAQPTFPILKGTVVPTPEPSPPGDIFEFEMSGNSKSNTPVCGQWTQTAAADQTITITGTNFSTYVGASEGKDTRFTVIGNNGKQTQAKIQRLDGYKAIITLDHELSPWSMYLIWPGNENGYGDPISINKTDAWWVGPEKASRGTVVSVYGRNLSHSNDTLVSNVYIKPINGIGQWVPVIKVNPYKIDFIIPSNISNGTYEIWTHNGHGGRYGWSGPLMLTINDATQWGSSLINVKNFGALGNGISDDTYAITRALAAAKQSQFSTVFFPSGVYLISDALFPSSDTRWLGTGKNNVTIRCNSNFSSKAPSMVYGAVNNFEMQDISFESNNNFKGTNLEPIYLRGSRDVVLNQIRFSFNGYGVLQLDNTYGVEVKNCEVIGKQCFLGTGSQIFIDSCSFRLTNDAETAIDSWGGVGISLTNSSCRDFDNSDINNGAGWGKGRFFTARGNFGSNRLTYIGNNSTQDLGARPDDSVDQNSGEQFLWEGYIATWSGNPSTVNGSTIGLKGFSSVVSTREGQAGKVNTQFAVIINGKGLGQSRRIISYSGETVSLDAPWTVEPNNESIITVGNFVDRTVLYKNYIDGKSYPVTKDNLYIIGSCGIETFGGTLNFIADQNEINELRYGIANWGTQLYTQGLDPNYFSFYANNKISNCRWAITNSLFLSRPSGKGILGTTYRNNSISNIIQSGIVYSVNNPISSGYTQDSSIVDCLVFEHNVFKSVTNGISTGNDIGLPEWFPQKKGDGIENQVLLKNVFIGNGNSSGFGINQTSKISLRQNLYEKLNIIYQNRKPDDIIETPYHVVEVNGIAGGPTVEASITLWNSGTSIINWKSSATAEWLTLNDISGVINKEGDSSIITLSANPLYLLPGEYRTDLTITSGVQSKLYQILFIIKPNVASNLRVVSSNVSSISLDWDSTSNDIGIKGYDVYIDSVKKYTTTRTDIIADSLKPNTTYSFVVKARGLSDSLSASSNSVLGTTTSAAPSGPLKYKYYEGSFSSLPDFSKLTPIKTGSSPNVDISVRTAGVNDNFAFVWEGYINIPTAGTYTFETISDDGSKLYFNSFYSPIANALVNNDGLHAAVSSSGSITISSAGTYPIAVTFFEQVGGETMQVYWSGPGIARQLIPNSAFMEASLAQTSNNLNYKYYEGSFSSLPDFNKLTPVKTGTSSNVDIGLRNPGVNDNFAFVWEGYIKIPTAGTYTFETISDDGSKLYFNSTYSANNNALVNNDGLHPATVASGTVTVSSPGSFPIAIAFFEQVGGETMQVYWSGPGIARQLIPNSAFTTTPPVPTSNNLNYKYYEGTFSILPDFNKLTPIKIGTSANVDINLRNQGVNDNFAFVWEGYINIPTAGNYTFETISDDGSKLYFNSTYAPGALPLVNNDGIHAAISATGSVNVPAPGPYPIAITFFEQHGGEIMQVYWSGPGIPRQLIPNSAFTIKGTTITSVNLSTKSAETFQLAESVNLQTKNFERLNVYPNPFTRNFNIDVYNKYSNKTISVALYDNAGKLLFNQDFRNIAVGNTTLKIEAGKIARLPGVYFVRLLTNGIPSKMIKLAKY